MAAAAEIGIIGLGHMRLPTAREMRKAGHAPADFDHSAEAVGAAAGAEVVVTMPPDGQHVRAVYLGDHGLLAGARPDALLTDCPAIDVETSRAVRAAAADRRLAKVYAPASGGVAGAEAGTLTFMPGGRGEAFGRARPVLERMGKAVIHAGASGNGRAPEICKDMLLEIHIVAVAEAFPPRRTARPARRRPVRDRQGLLGAMLVDDDLLPGPVLARRPGPSSPASRP